MTLTMKDNIRDWQTVCSDQMSCHRYPLVDANAAQHQFYGYLVALKDTGFITEDELFEAMKKFRLEISLEMPTDPIPSFRHETSKKDTDALNRRKEAQAALEKYIQNASHQSEGISPLDLVLQLAKESVQGK